MNRMTLAAAAAALIASPALAQTLDTGLGLEAGGTGLGIERDGIGAAEYGDRGLTEPDAPLGDALLDDRPLIEPQDAADDFSGVAEPGAAGGLSPVEPIAAGDGLAEGPDPIDDPAGPLVEDRPALSRDPLLEEPDGSFTALEDSVEPVQGGGGEIFE